MTTLTFETYVEDVLAPTLQPGEVLLLDNLSAHKGGSVQATLEAYGVQVIFCRRIRPTSTPLSTAGPKPLMISLLDESY